MVIYISGPVSGVPNYREAFVKAKTSLEARGYETISILDCEFLQKDSFNWSDCMKFCIAMLEKCDGILMLRGWRASVGATIEKAWAEKSGIPVYESHSFRSKSLIVKAYILRSFRCKILSLFC